MTRHTRKLALACLLAAGLTTSLAACRFNVVASGKGQLSPSSTPSSTSSASASGSTTPSASATPTPTHSVTPAISMIHVSSPEWDGETFGVGMPIILTFNKLPTNVKAFEAATTVTVNGTAVKGAWYWYNAGRPGIAIDADFRTQSYWPGHATINLNAALKGVSAGTGLQFDSDFTLALATGPSDISTVNASTLQMTVTRDGKLVRTLPVSLGEAEHPTESGVKVVEEKDNPERMIGPGYNVLVPWSVRITNSGEFVHAAPWNSQIGQASTSHGCTNLTTADAEWFYNFANIGDVVIYPHTDGPVMPVWDGYGDWNVSWSQWVLGGQETD